MASEQVVQSIDRENGEPSLDGVLEELREAVAEIQRVPTFLAATELSKKTRRAWSAVYGHWLSRGRSQVVEKAGEFVRLTQEGLTAAEQVPPSSNPEEVLRLNRYNESIRFRNEVVKILLEKGADAVHEKLQDHLNEFANK